MTKINDYLCTFEYPSYHNHSSFRMSMLTPNFNKIYTQAFHSSKLTGEKRPGKDSDHVKIFSPLAIWKTLEDWTGWTSDLFSNDNDTVACDLDHLSHPLNQTHPKEESAQCILQVCHLRSSMIDTF